MFASQLTIPSVATVEAPNAITDPLSVPTRRGTPRKRAYGIRRTYAPELRAQALALIAQGQTQAATARQLGVVEVTVNSWVSAARRAEQTALAERPLGGVRADLLALRMSLQSRIRELGHERDALSKTLASVIDALDL